jgi:hypothetical protein
MLSEIFLNNIKSRLELLSAHKYLLFSMKKVKFNAVICFIITKICLSELKRTK